MPTTFAALMCHAPIVLPAVGRDRIAQCQRTTRAMREVAARAVAAQPERIVLTSPHAPRRRGRFGAWVGPHRADLRRFGAPQLAIDLPDAPEVASALGVPPIHGDLGEDHGALVPLLFLWEAGWRGPTAILALPWEPDPGVEPVGLGVSALPGHTAFIASGDMSHRLIEGAPAGHHPEAWRFDAAFVDALRRDDWDTIRGALPMRPEAAEDVVVSTRVAMAAAGSPVNAEVLSYEGPWGVGYTEAVLFDAEPHPIAVARRSVRNAVEGHGWPRPRGGGSSQGLFVTLRSPDGSLRGCIGHMSANRPTLNEELWDVARSAAIGDPRFHPVAEHELDGLRYEISLLEPTERVASEAELDPVRYGVVVSARGRRGVLLPDLEGVDTVAMQLSICRQKAGLSATEPVDLERFVVTKLVEPGAELEGSG